MPKSLNWFDRKLEADPLGLVRLAMLWFGIAAFSFALLAGVLNGQANPWRAGAFLGACLLGTYGIWRYSKTKVGGIVLASMTLVVMAVFFFLQFGRS
jgi:hypothetical protein